MNNMRKITLRIVIAAFAFGSQSVSGSQQDTCENPYACIGMAIDSGDPVLIQMGREMSNLVTEEKAGTVVKPTAGPIANVGRMLSRENVGLTIVPSDMLLYTSRSEEAKLHLAKDRLRFIMTIGRKVVHVIAREEIKSLADLAGKRVVMGPDNTALWVVSSNLLYLHGVTPKERIQLKPVAGVTAVLLGDADAAFVIGDAPMGVIQKLSDLRQSDALGPDAGKVHMLELKFATKGTGYQAATVNYPGFAENAETVAILPTLVSYDFTHKSSPYFQRRCSELTKIGETVRDRIEELRVSGHKQWKATKWEMEAGNWEKDKCFFGTATQQLSSDPNVAVKASSQAQARSELMDERASVREAQEILNRLGYDVGAADGIMGPKTRAGIKQFQTDQGMTPNGMFNFDLLTILRVREKLQISSG
jgi:TRAP-type uncharacterized transport system substrate-binding protein